MPNMIKGYVISEKKDIESTIGTYVYEQRDEAEDEMLCLDNANNYNIIEVEFPDNTIDESDMEDYLGEDADYPSDEAFEQLSKVCDAVAIQDNANGDYLRFYILQPSQVKVCK